MLTRNYSIAQRSNIIKFLKNNKINIYTIYISNL